MPKTYLTKEMRLRENFAAWVYGQMRVNGKTQQNVSKMLGLTQQGLSLKLKRQSFSFDDVCTLMEYFQPDEKTILQLVGADEWDTRG
jgi:predicted XRE-type DNA-binding protein